MKVELSSSIGLGLILKEVNSGVIYSNQVGGYACHHPEVEGAYIPLLGYESPIVEEIQDYFTGAKWNGWCCEGIDEETANYLDHLFSEDTALASIRVDRDQLKNSQEAWIHVVLVAGSLSGCLGILTWDNSD